uniref:Uncharacterized protein n=1 Tax=Candidatus Kentrum sp. DK TaxID=2126562 RepID=A0A450SZ88_9GAMM|nr:MAG: hypothetical protein BECKDK2373C_GA0170839_107121 [Candidatus Kentron sp. DK]
MNGKETNNASETASATDWETRMQAALRLYVESHKA